MVKASTFLRTCTNISSYFRKVLFEMVDCSSQCTEKKKKTQNKQTEMSDQRNFKVETED